jgi:DDE family transposase
LLRTGGCFVLYDADSLLGRLHTLPDPRRRQGRRYPLPALLGLLVLAALHGETSLRGMWLWARQHWNEVWWPLGFGSPHFPALTTIWNLLGVVDADAVDRIVSAWLAEVLGQPVGGVSADGKVLRGSRRDELPGMWLVALARHDVGSVMRQRQVVPGSHELPTLLALLRDVPLHDQIVTLDAGLLCADTTQVVRTQHGDYLGVVKRNQADIKAAVDDWISEQLLSPSAGSTSCPHSGEVAGATRNP